MTTPAIRVRRATVDDLGALKPLWESMQLPVLELEKHLTEFQVAENGAGEVVGAVGFRMSGRYGCIYGEGYTDYSLADLARPLFAERLQVLAANHGVIRVWTQETAPYWMQQGFVAADEATLKKLPAAWLNENPHWLTLQLKSEDALVAAEKELAVFMQAEKARTEQIQNQARIIKFIATGLAILFGILVVGGLVFMLKKNGISLLPAHR